jgi:hypothetical protein
MNILVKMKFGAHLYGTATSESDVDYKGVFMPSKEEVLLGRIPKSHSHSTAKDESKNTKNDIDVEMYSFQYFIKLACDGQTVAMDMLHAPEDMILQSSNIWKTIIKNRHKFYTKNLKSFIDYARRQASKYGIKGSRINAALQVLELLNKKITYHDDLTAIPMTNISAKHICLPRLFRADEFYMQTHSEKGGNPC